MYDKQTIQVTVDLENVLELLVEDMLIDNRPKPMAIGEVVNAAILHAVHTIRNKRLAGQAPVKEETSDVKAD